MRAVPSGRRQSGEARPARADTHSFTCDSRPDRTALGRTTMACCVLIAIAIKEVMSGLCWGGG